MKIAILSDTHGTLDPRIEAQVLSCDLAVHAGDVGSAAVLRCLRPRGKLVAVRGNNDTKDKWPAQDHAQLRALPDEAELALPGGVLRIVHGDAFGPPARRHARLRAAYPQARLIVYGHSHRLVVDRAHCPWVLNPGAAGRARTYGGPSCVLLTIDDGGWRLQVKRFAAAAGR